jgi:hypothetical protein
MPSAFAAMAGQGVARANGDGSAVPTIVFHGHADRTVNPVNAEKVIAQATPKGTLKTEVTHGKTPAGMSYSRTVQFDREGRAVVEQWTLHSAGHGDR